MARKTMKVQHPEQQLETLLDHITLSTLLDEVGDICQGKADEESDRQFASAWQEMADCLGESARRAARYRI